MFRNGSQHRFNGRNDRHHRGGGGRSFRGPGRTGQSINPALFVKKATAAQEPEYIPVHQFSDFPFGMQLHNNIVAKGYKSPTPIQDKVIPEILAKKDVIGIANTGTGKTAAFLLPLIQKITEDYSQKVLVVTPTRELAVQIEEEFRDFSKHMGISLVLVIGGMQMSRQLYSLRQRPAVIIGTPGRLIDLEKQGYIQFNAFNNIVLDEVDRMLDMGFISDISYIIRKLPAVRQSLFFSATVPETARGVMKQFVTNPVTVSVKTQQSSDRVNQDIIKVNGKVKIEMLHELLVQEGFSKVLLFGRTKWGIEKLSKQLHERGFKVAAIHGDKRQSQRNRALEEFKNSRIQVLLATDIASRGIDVPDVTHVINYDPPQSYEDYIHRIGRTGRATKFGTALTFVE